MTTPNNLRLIPPVGHPCWLRYGVAGSGYTVEIEVCDGLGLPARTRTPQPVPHALAHALWCDSLAQRLGRGWHMDVPDVVWDTVGDPIPPSPADAILLARLEPDAWRLLAPGQQCRTVWRVGERGLVDAAERLVAILGTAAPLLDYCVAWALGRLKDAGAAPALAQLAERASTPHVARIARLGWLACAGADVRAAWAHSVVDEWPSALRKAWSAQDQSAMDTLLAEVGEPPHADSVWSRIAYPVWLVQLDDVAWALRDGAQAPWARDMLLRQIEQLQLDVGTFRAWRRLFKAAELRCDAAVFGALVHLLETRRTTPESAMACTRATRNYFRRRSWRVLRRLGNDGDPRFVTMAAGLLMACDGAASARWCAFNHLLYRHDQGMQASRNGLVWQRQRVPLPGVRTEAFPALWDRYPQALLGLLISARATAVSGFAALALARRAGWAQQANALMVVRLLLHPQANARRLGIDLALRRLERLEHLDAQEEAWPGLFGGDQGWLQLMLHAPHADVWQAALDVITANPARYSADGGMVLAMLTAPSSGVRSHARLLLQAAIAHPGLAGQLCQGLLLWLTQTDPLDDSLNAFEAQERRLDTLVWALATPLRAAAGLVDAPTVFALLVHPLALVRAVAAHWLLLLGDAQTYLAQVDIQAFLDSSLGPLRAAGVHLVGGMPEALLLQRPALLASFCANSDKDVRVAGRELLARLAPNDDCADYADRVVMLLRERLFQGVSEADVARPDAEELKDDVLTILTGLLAAAARRTDHGSQMCLLLAKSRGAQQFGAWLLLPQPPQAFTVRECAALAGVSAVAVREWALRAVDHAGRLSAQPEDGFALFNSRWPEVRAFAQSRYSLLDASAWTIPTLLLLCDHTQAQAQALGRQLLTQHFDPAQIANLLPQLAQHPSIAMQTFVAQALVRHVDALPALPALPAQDDPAELILQLAPYLLTVLSHVNRSRVAKDALHQWLQRLATRSPRAADAVVGLYSRLVLSDAQGDRTVYVQMLNQLRNQYPDQASPIVQIPLPRRPARRNLPVPVPGAGEGA